MKPYLFHSESEAASPATQEGGREQFVAVDGNHAHRISGSETAAWVTQRVSIGDTFKKIDRESNASLKWKEMTSIAPSGFISASYPATSDGPWLDLDESGELPNPGGLPRSAITQLR